MSLSVDLFHRLGGFDLEVAFQAPAGVTALFGPSGAGKTTVVNAVAGLLRPDCGRIAVGGTALLDRDMGIDLPPHRRRVGYVFQDARLFPHLTVQRNLDYGRWFARHASRSPSLAEIVDLLGLAHLLGRQPRALSGGEAQRVALGRALLAQPRLLLMDEPLAALDQTRKGEILPYLERLRDHAKVPILYVSHAAEEVRRLATTVVRMERGRVSGQGSAAEMLGAAPSRGTELVGTLREMQDDVACLDTPIGLIRLVSPPPGPTVRLHIPADSVLIATVAPHGLLASAILPGMLAGQEWDGLLSLHVGDTVLLASRPPCAVPAIGTRVFAVLTAPPQVLRP